MAHEISQIEGDLVYLRCWGTMRKADLAKSQELAGLLIDQGRNPRLLVILEDFKGWSGDDDWGDIGFLIEYGDRIRKMAIVGDENWKDQAYLFVGKGLRSTEIEFFPVEALNEAERWLRA